MSARIHELADEQSQADRRWFEEHPGRKHRIRSAHPAEIAEFEIVLNEASIPPPEGFALYIAVKNLFPGVRLRAPFCRGAGFPVWDIDEVWARKIYDDVAPPKAREIEKKLRRLGGRHRFIAVPPGAKS